MAKKPDSKTIKLRTVGLFKSTLNTWKKDFNNYSKVVLIVALPAAIINILQNQGIVGEFGLILSFVWSFAIIAVLLLAQKERKLADTKLSTVFTAASARLLQYVGASLVLLLFALPAIAGLLGLFLSLPAFGLPALLFVPLGLVGLVLGVYLLCRYCIVQSITTGTASSVVSSFRQSAKLTKGNRLRIFLAYFILIALMLLLLTAIQFVLGLNQSINENAILGSFLYVVEAAILVPIFFIFQVKIYESLDEKA